MRTYWRLRVKSSRKDQVIEYVYFRTDKPLSPEAVVKASVKEKMLLDVFVPYVDQVLRITEGEYFEQMLE